MPQKNNSKAKKTGKCHVCGDAGHFARDCKERKSDSKKVGLQDTTRKCNVYGETGHYARECKGKKSDTVKMVLKEILGFETKSNMKAQGWYLAIGSSAHVCYSRTCKVLTLSNVLHIPKISKCIVSVSKLDVLGYIMSLGGGRCVIKNTHEVIVHVCNSRDMFVDYQPVTGYEVVLENNSPVDVVGFRTVKLQFTTGKVLTLENVFHIPKIIKCCISVGKLIMMGFTVGFWCEGCDIKKVIDHEVNLDIDDHADVTGIGKSVFSITCGDGEYVIKLGGVVTFKGYHDGVLYKNNLMLEPPLAKVVHHETIGLLIAKEHPDLTKSGVRGWYLLSMCTMHVCNLRDMFVDYQPVTGHEVVLKNYSRVDVVGFGTVKLQLTTGNVLTLENVFHIPSIIRCCLSMNKLLEMGFGVGLHAEGCYVKKGQQIVGNGVVENGLFKLGVIDERSGGNQA
ncbi:hypothetical protein CTI12_AA438110 [Artemisia annua]|uniref:CCHC-type domain-containing protein n=1 Tax=Artemisia annua TaxID=35608 RepID=A0A2U1LYT7_ARTAN|nr:hypothetical protein CTI12_AA438110 [Artemisia annua]